MLAISRDGAPLVSGSGHELPEIMKFIDSLTEVLGQMNPANPRPWKDRMHYFAAVRPEQFRGSRAEPLLVGHPLRADGLRQRGVRRVEARLAVAADGAISGVELLPESQVPEAMQAPLTDALRRVTPVLPAIDHGQPVPGHVDLLVDVPPADAQADADAAWLSGDQMVEILFSSWLVLKPIRVPEQEFVNVDYVTADGVYVTKPLEVSSARVSRTQQLSAFSTNWFDEAGADSVRPAAGDKVVIDGKELAWQRIEGRHGLVDFQLGGTRLDYSIGYAWTEFEMPSDVDAWLGIGSDDGLKIWHNGRLVHDKWIRRISRIDDDVVPLRLNKGKHRLLIKIQNATGDWSFISRLRIRAK